MAKHIQLKIAEPCHENWNKMTPVEKGRFCGSCQKQVVDFTGMSDEQLAFFFKKTSGDSTCGRFTKDQLEREIVIPRKRIPWVKYFFQFALPAFLVSGRASAQGKVMAEIRSEVTKDNTKKSSQAVPDKSNPAIVIKGKVMDTEGYPLYGATVMIKGTTFGTAVDSTGAFKLNYDGADKTVVLVTSYVGYEETETSVDLAKPVNYQAIEVRPPMAIMGDVVVVAGLISFTDVEQQTDGIRQIPVSEDTVDTRYKVFPNPVAAGANLTIGWGPGTGDDYSVYLTNTMGQQVYQKRIWLDAETRVLNLNMPYVRAGNYVLKIVGRKSKESFTQKLVIR